MITGPASYVSTMNAFAQHWLSANQTTAPAVLIIGLADKTSITQGQFVTLRGALEARQLAVQSALVDAQVARGNVNILKVELLKKFNLFNSLLDGYYSGTGYYAARPYAPGIGEGKDNFAQPLGKAMTMWEKMNTDAAPAGVTLPLVLGDGTTQGTYASELSALAFAYAQLEARETVLDIERGKRNVIQERAYETMRLYRELAPDKFVLHPELIESLPRLTPLPGHTPARVNASAIFEAPDQSKIVYEASTEATLEKYELRGNVGDEYSDEDSFVIATHQPGDPREFLTDFGLNQPGAKVALKVYVLLTTGNEAGSAVMFVQRPLAQVA